MTVRTPEEQAAIDEQRKSIKNNADSVEKDENGNIVIKKAVEDKKDDNKEEIEEPEKKEEVENKTEDNKEEIEEIEDKEEELAAAKAAATTAKEKERIQKRIDKEVAKRKALEEENEELKKQLAAKDAEGDKYTKEDLDKKAEELAAQKQLQKQFTDDCNKLTAAAEKFDKEFVKKIQEIGKDIGPIPGHMIGILADLDNGGQILHHFTKDDNQEEYERIIALSPAKAAMELTKLSGKLEPPRKQISKVPEPNEPIRGGQAIMTGSPKDSDSMDVWMQKRNAQAAERRKQKVRY